MGGSVQFYKTGHNSRAHVFTKTFNNNKNSNTQDVTTSPFGKSNFLFGFDKRIGPNQLYCKAFT